MRSTTVRISKKAKDLLADLATQRGETMQTVLDRAIDEYWRRALLEETNRAFEALRRDPKAWAEEVAERAAWDSTIGDGLDED